MANSQGEGNAFATPRSSTWTVLNCILFVIVLDSCCWWLDKRLSRVFKGQTGFEFWVLRFRDLGASFSRFGFSVFEFWVLCFEDLGASFWSLGCFVFEIWVLCVLVFVFEWFVFETTLYFYIACKWFVSACMFWQSKCTSSTRLVSKSAIAITSSMSNSSCMLLLPLHAAKRQTALSITLLFAGQTAKCGM